MREMIAGLMVLGVPGIALDEGMRGLLSAGLAGAYLGGHNIHSRAQLTTLTTAIQQTRQQSAANVPGSALPKLILVEHEGGTVHHFGTIATHFPPPMALGATNSEELARQVAEQMAAEVARLGVNCIVGPLFDRTSPSPRSSLGTRTFAAEPRTVGRLGAAMIRGYREAGVLSVAKHFPGLGRAHDEAHVATPTVLVDAAALAEDLDPFRDAVAAGVDVMMTAHAAYPTIGSGHLPATLDPRITRLLREDVGFSGPVMTSDLTLTAVKRTGSYVAQLARRALLAGAQLLLISDAGRHPEEIVDTLARMAEADETLAAAVKAAHQIVVGLRERLAEPRSAEAESAEATQALGRRGEELARVVALQSIAVLGPTAFRPLQVAADDWLPVVLPQSQRNRFGNDPIRGHVGWFAEFILEYHSKLRVVNVGGLVSHLDRAREATEGCSAAIVLLWASGPSAERLCRELAAKVRQLYVLWLGRPQDAVDLPPWLPVLCTYGTSRASLWAAARVLFGLESSGVRELPRLPSEEA